MADKERLDVLLVERGLCPTREQARARILAGEVVVNDHRVDKPGTRVARHAAIRLKGEALPFVGRGGLKLAHALGQLGIHVRDRVALDVGASTGGFTDVLLKGGARQVYAVDVGHGQLAEALRRDRRVVSMERTHIRDVPPLVPAPDFCCIDVSFISLRLVLPHVARLLSRPAEVVALVKPQFEVGRGLVGKGGIVRDQALRQRAVEEVRAAARGLGFADQAVLESPVTGQKGNVEYLLFLRLPQTG